MGQPELRDFCARHKNSPEFWMNLQAHYDLKVARRGLSPQEIRRIKGRRAA
jgi:plasmid maintenance system antidote protein VapI